VWIYKENLRFFALELERIHTSAMALKFQVRSTQLDAWFATGWGDHAISGFNPVVLAVNSNPGVFGGYHIDNKVQSGSPKILNFSALDNWAIASGAFSLLLRVIPTWTGAPSAGAALFQVTGGSGPYQGTSAIAINSSGGIQFVLVDQYDNTIISNSTSAISWVNGVPVDIWITWDGTVNANTFQVWSAQNGSTPTILGSFTAGMGSTPGNRSLYAGFSLGAAGALDGFGPGLTYLNELVIWDTVVSPTSFGARTTFIPTSAVPFQGYSQSDPGSENVLFGIYYVASGVTKTGSLSPASNIMRQMQLKQNPTTNQALVITQGDSLILDLQAIDDTNLPHNLNGATFSTNLLNQDGTVLTLGNSAHTPDADQSANTGNFRLQLTGTSILKIGAVRSLITTVIQGSDVIQYHGTIQILSSTIT
jgi:hypothetical protein